MERGYLDAEADGLFHGDNPVSRYDLAGVIARLLDDIEAGGCRSAPRRTWTCSGGWNASFGRSWWSGTRPG